MFFTFAYIESTKYCIFNIDIVCFIAVLWDITKYSEERRHFGIVTCNYMIVCYRMLQPHEQLLYTWENPTGSHCLAWNAGKKKEITVELRKVNYFCYFSNLAFAQRCEVMDFVYVLNTFHSVNEILCVADLALPGRNVFKACYCHQNFTCHLLFSVFVERKGVREGKGETKRKKLKKGTNCEVPH